MFTPHIFQDTPHDQTPQWEVSKRVHPLERDISIACKSCEAGGLLLTLRRSSTLQFLLVLRYFLQPLARLSKTLQSSSGNIAAAMAAVKATTAALRDDFSLEDIKKQCQEMSEQATAAGVKMEQGSLTENQKNAICEKYHKVVVENLDARFSDAVTHLCEVGNGTIVPNGSMPVQYCSLFTVLLVFR